MLITPVILCGGSGKRLWPLSRKEFPKQYLNLISDKTMLQETILRLSGLKNLSSPIIVCNDEHRFLVSEQCKQINIKSPKIILEHIGKNTAPAIAASALQCIKDLNDSLLLILSADHFIGDVESFHQSINIASISALDGRLTTFGIKPTYANTGYGYIEYSKENNNKAFEVKRFVEKPDKKTAQYYFKSENYFWNSGIFMFKASTMIQELNFYNPKIVKLVSSALDNAREDLGFIKLEKKYFESTPNISIDYALLEKSNNVVVVPMDVQWADIGSWEALYDIGKKDEKGNVILGDVYLEDSKNSYVNSTEHMIAIIGVEDLVVVETRDVTFISKKNKSQHADSFVNLLTENGRNESEKNRKVFRPWGWYDSIESGTHFQVKKLHVKSGAKLSLQFHNKRAEHWVVVSGQATVKNGDQSLILNKGDSTYIPIGTPHCLENKTEEILEVIEVQSGTYLEEDDIVRLEDDYGRK
jgi:mannose-1-phosphate guanylyltransferase / mannose-6-phosphate isomerase